MSDHWWGTLGRKELNQIVCTLFIFFTILLGLFSLGKENVSATVVGSHGSSNPNVLSSCFPKSIDPKLALKSNLWSFFFLFLSLFFFPTCSKGNMWALIHQEKSLYIHQRCFYLQISTTTWSHLRILHCCRDSIKIPRISFTDLLLLLLSLVQSSLSPLPQAKLDVCKLLFISQ